MLSLLRACFVVLPSVIEHAVCKMVPPRQLEVDDSASVIGDSSLSIMELVQECMLLDHYSVIGRNIRILSVNIMKLYLSRRSINTLVKQLRGVGPANDYLLKPNSLYQVSRRLCLVLQLLSTENGYDIDSNKIANTGISYTANTFSVLLDSIGYCSCLQDIVDCIVYVIKVLVVLEEDNHHVNSSSGTKSMGNKRLLEEQKENQLEMDMDEDNGGDIDDIFGESLGQNEVDEDEDNSGMQEQNGTGGAGTLGWTMQRLRYIGLNQVGSKRYNVCAVFIQLLCEVKEHEVFVDKHLRQMMEVSYRASMNCDPNCTAHTSGTTLALGGSSSSITPGSTMDKLLNGEKNMLMQVIYEKSSECLQLLEKTVDSSRYIGTLAEIEDKIRHDKASRKEELAKEALLDPQAHAQRKVNITIYHTVWILVNNYCNHRVICFVIVGSH